MMYVVKRLRNQMLVVRYGIHLLPKGDEIRTITFGDSTQRPVVSTSTVAVEFRGLELLNFGPGEPFG